MNEIVAYLLLLIFFAFASIGIATVFIGPDYSGIIQACEKELPRNKHCKLIAVVDEGGRS